MSHRLTSEAAIRGSSLLHHLLNQSLSGLDFCILWQELAEKNEELSEVDLLVRRFLSEADLTSLDCALALLPEPETLTPQPLETRVSLGYQGWTVQSQRQRDVSRADFRCADCGFEITLSQEHAPNTEMRLPFDQLVCPICT